MPPAASLSASAAYPLEFRDSGLDGADMTFDNDGKPMWNGGGHFDYPVVEGTRVDVAEDGKKISYGTLSSPRMVQSPLHVSSAVVVLGSAQRSSQKSATRNTLCSLWTTSVTAMSTTSYFGCKRVSHPQLNPPDVLRSAFHCI